MIIPEFSVLITVYNKENPVFFKQALDSITSKQTIKPSQIVIVKDGPLTEQLDGLINKYVNKYGSLFHIISLEKNMKQGYAANAGGKECQFDLIARMDADDIAFPDRFERQIKYLIKNNLDIVGGQIIEFKNVKEEVVSVRKVPEKHVDIVKMMKYKMPLSNPTVIFRKEVFDTINGYDPKSIPEDYDFFVRACQKGFIFGNVPFNVLWFRLGSDKDQALRRRHGGNYAKNEYKMYKKFYKIGYYSFYEFLKVILIKIPIRLLPFKLFKFLYYKLFRKI
ncbi:amylovoran biosynthesis protein AmsE [Polaribacter sp. ALD11]|uniref:glycosyltransferase n=1 Tax=Polaribacter sp. ALD11 TaxID=2058137 RepID=UPI000C30F937|nr:glycosyltransferase [Polaribacter sp. ALD11]AUC85231.1 amylovoran biosynthesis protein AmsE [Polaribacter sp. ALD11]